MTNFLSKKEQFKVYHPMFTKLGFVIMSCYSREGARHKFRDKFKEEPTRLEIFEIGKGYVPA